MYKGAVILLMLGLLMTALPSHAAEQPGTPVSKILASKTSLGLTDVQVKKLQTIDQNTREKMIECKKQAEIRFNEIEQFTANWVEMNSVAVQTLIREYFDYMAQYKLAEVDAMVKARAILTQDQMARMQQLASINALMKQIEPKLISAKR